MPASSPLCVAVFWLWLLKDLKEKQQFNIDMEQKKNILSTVIALEEGVDINQLYAKRVKAFVVDFQGSVKEGMQPKDVNLAAEYKKPR